MSGRRAGDLAITFVMNVLLVLAFVLLLRLVVEFFGTIAAHDVGGVLVRLTDPLHVPFGLTAPRTPYGGVFDSDAAVTILLLVGIEWMLSLVRASRQRGYSQ